MVRATSSSTPSRACAPATLLRAAENLRRALHAPSARGSRRASRCFPARHGRRTTTKAAQAGSAPGGWPMRWRRRAQRRREGGAEQIVPVVKLLFSEVLTESFGFSSTNIRLSFTSYHSVDQLIGIRASVGAQRPSREDGGFLLIVPMAGGKAGPRRDPEPCEVHGGLAGELSWLGPRSGRPLARAPPCAGHRAKNGLSPATDQGLRHHSCWCRPSCHRGSLDPAHRLGAPRSRAGARQARRTVDVGLHRVDAAGAARLLRPGRHRRGCYPLPRLAWAYGPRQRLDHHRSLFLTFLVGAIITAIATLLVLALARGRVRRPRKPRGITWTAGILVSYGAARASRRPFRPSSSAGCSAARKASRCPRLCFIEGRAASRPKAGRPAACGKRPSSPGMTHFSAWPSRGRGTPVHLRQAKTGISRGTFHSRAREGDRRQAARCRLDARDSSCSFTHQRLSGVSPGIDLAAGNSQSPAISTCRPAAGRSGRAHRHRPVPTAATSTSGRRRAAAGSRALLVERRTQER